MQRARGRLSPNLGGASLAVSGGGRAWQSPLEYGVIWGRGGGGGGAPPKNFGGSSTCFKLNIIVSNSYL